MSEKRDPGVLGSLPRTRPHRRSDKRAALVRTPAAEATPAVAPAEAAVKPRPAAVKLRPAAAKPTKKPAARQPAARQPAAREPAPGPLGTTVQAAAELTEIGLHAGARALRRALSRLPRP